MKTYKPEEIVDFMAESTEPMIILAESVDGYIVAMAQDTKPESKMQMLYSLTRTLASQGAFTTEHQVAYLMFLQDSFESTGSGAMQNPCQCENCVAKRRAMN